MRLIPSVFLASAIIFSIISFSLGVVALTDYLDQRAHLLNLVPKAAVHDVAYVGAVSYNICASILSLLVLVTLLACHVRQYTAIRRVSIICAMVTGLLGLANALTLTVITATKAVSYGDVGPRVTEYLDAAAETEGIPLLYRDDAVAVAAVVFSWVGWVCSVLGCFMLLKGSKTNSAGQEGNDVKTEKRTYSQDSSAATAPKHA